MCDRVFWRGWYLQDHRWKVVASGSRYRGLKSLHVPGPGKLHKQKQKRDQTSPEHRWTVPERRLGTVLAGPRTLRHSGGKSCDVSEAVLSSMATLLPQPGYSTHSHPSHCTTSPLHRHQGCLVNSLNSKQLTIGLLFFSTDFRKTFQCPIYDLCFPLLYLPILPLFGLFPSAHCCWLVAKLYPALLWPSWAVAL